MMRQRMEPFRAFSPNDPPAGGDGETQTIRQLRDQIKALETDLGTLRTENKTLKDAQTQAEREKLSEIDRLKAELVDRDTRIQELQGYQARVEKLDTSLKATYEAKLAQVPEEHRERIGKLSGFGQWEDRLDALETACALLPAAAPNPTPTPPTKAGTPSQPPPASTAGTPAPTDGAGNKQPLDLKTIATTSWSDVFQKSA